MMCERFVASQQVHTALTSASPTSTISPSTTSTSTSVSYKGMRLLISSIGRYQLPASGGVSSSAALTGAFSMSLNAIHTIGLTMSHLSQVDFGEYYLGKSAGAADKMAQLSSLRSQIVVVGSVPERLIARMNFPTHAITLLLAECPVPRLTTAEGIKYLQTKYPAHATQAVTWASSIMKRFCSLTYDVAARMLTARLRLIIDDPSTAVPSPTSTSSDILGNIDEARAAIKRSGITRDEALILLTSLQDQSAWLAPFDGVSAAAAATAKDVDHKSSSSHPPAKVPSVRVSLLRELCTDGYLGTRVEAYRSRQLRYYSITFLRQHCCILYVFATIVMD
jgi:hypothetical protein